MSVDTGNPADITDSRGDLPWTAAVHSYTLAPGCNTAWSLSVSLQPMYLSPSLQDYERAYLRQLYTLTKPSGVAKPGPFSTKPHSDDQCLHT